MNTKNLINTKNFTRTFIFQMLISLFVLTLGSCGQEEKKHMSDLAAELGFEFREPYSGSGLNLPSLEINQPGPSGSTPLYHACKLGYMEPVKALIKLGAKINLANNKGHTPLYIACKKGDQEIVTLLLENGATINSSDNHGHTPLHIACEKGYLGIVTLLIKNGATIHQEDVKIAHHKGHAAIADLLREHK